MTALTVTVIPVGHQFACAPDTLVLDAVERAGTRSVDIGCRRGGCGVCRVQVLAGVFTGKVMSKAHVTAEDIASGLVLACRIFPTTDLVIEPRPKRVGTPTVRSKPLQPGRVTGSDCVLTNEQPSGKRETPWH